MTQLTETCLDKRLDTALEIVREAGDIALAAFRAMTPEKIAFKGPQDFLTATDLEVETLIRRRLSDFFPEDGILGEEAGGDVQNNTWIIDPIDGTANFARGIPHFCIVLGFVSQNKTRFGIIYDPCHDELYVAQDGKGATLNGKAIKVANTTSFCSANLELGWSQRVPNERYLTSLQGFLELGANVRRSACGALALAYVAVGRTDGYVEHHMNPWDCVAGLLLVSEAGGITNPFTADNNWPQGGAVLASTPQFARTIADITGITID
ncbi:inositol monophosphatase [Photobacterium sp. BZF1]|uniref:inositol monophosphatase family protein n=1 Tax=Photobacterium sp. BZF1 TaxID=1904457 RepID=UPI0016534D3F|nr:inositol monophosphatase [Photobacterium sp. BZF1]MBC7006630.1 inositol monophosphatase [Photobacterium sp. BZF1]